VGTNIRIDLLIPGLFGPVPMLAEDLPDLPILAKLLGKGDRTPAGGGDLVTLLLDLFGIGFDAERDPPSAPFSRLADGGDGSPHAFWLHAEPVHLRPDRDRLLLFDARHLGLERSEVSALVELFNAHFAEDGLYLEAPVDARWYLRAERVPQIRTSALADVVGRSVKRSFLHGEDASSWMRWLNEAQMLFHHSEVNRSRELAGRPTVSGIWPWGGGSLPDSMPSPRYLRVFASHPLAVGLAKAAGVPVMELPVEPRELPGEAVMGRDLIVWDDLWPPVLDGDAGAWIGELTRLAAWLEGLVGQLARGNVDELVLHSCDGSGLRVTRAALRRFWRRPAAIAGCLKGMPT
jgi:hypothetical protein